MMLDLRAGRVSFGCVVALLALSIVPALAEPVT